MNEAHFDSNRYLALYPDLLEHVGSNKAFPNACTHFNRHGKYENRLGFDKRFNYTFAFGAFGSNNLGDDAIADALVDKYENLILICIKKRYRPHDLLLEQILGNKYFFQEKDHLIIGGGGIFASDESISAIHALTKLCIQSAGKYSVERVGLEYFDDTSISAVEMLKGLLQDSISFSVRTHYSQELISRLFNLEVKLELDFAFFHKPGNFATSESALRVGIVVSDYSIEKIKMYSNLFSKFMNYPNVEFYGIAHSRSFFQANNNDLITLEKIWSDFHEYSRLEKSYQVLNFSSNVRELLNNYSMLDCVISERYHGCIFSIINKKPLLINTIRNIKLNSFSKFSEWEYLLENYNEDEDFENVAFNFILKNLKLKLDNNSQTT